MEQTKESGRSKLVIGKGEEQHLEQVFILRNIVEQVNEWQATIYVNFIDFEKAFDSVHRDSLWIIMRKYGIPEKIMRTIQLFYADFQCAVEDQGERGEWFV